MRRTTGADCFIVLFSDNGGRRHVTVVSFTCKALIKLSESPKEQETRENGPKSLTESETFDPPFVHPKLGHIDVTLGFTTYVNSIVLSPSAK